MTMNTLFEVGNLLVMPFWLLMILLPHWSWTRRFMASPWVCAGPALIYLVLALPTLPSLLGLLAKPELPKIAALLGTEQGATLGWLHFLAFDLFVGRWVYLDSRERNRSALLMGPVLFLTLMFGPIGLLLYLALRQFLPGPEAKR